MTGPGTTADSRHDSSVTDSPTSVRFNPFSAAFRKDPYAQYRGLQVQEAPQKALGMWVITRYAEVQAVLSDHRTFSSAVIPQLVNRRADRLSQSNVARIERLGKKSLVFTDNPDHARLRGLVNQAFSSKAIAALRPGIASAADQLMMRAERDGGMDVISDYAAVLPITVMCDWMGLPESIRRQVGAWTHDIRFLLEPGMMSAAVFGRVCDVVECFTDALADVVDHRASHPGDDLISQLLSAKTAGGDSFDVEEIVFLCIMCFVAGGETTTSLIGNGVLALALHPDQALALHRDPSLANAAVTEAIRYDSPLQMTKRLATRDTEIAGREVKAGDQVLLCLGAANRDPSVFDGPELFELTRAGARHLAFGHGMHGCLGGVLAQLQAEVAFGTLYRRTVRIELATREVDWQTDSLIVRGPASLPVRLTTVAV